MLKKYLVTGNWMDKASNNPVSGIAEVTEGVNKNGQPYAIANTENREIIDGAYPVGTILTANMNLSVHETPAKSKA